MPVLGIEEGGPERADLVTGPRSIEPRAGGGEHEGEDPVDDDERPQGADRVHPSHSKVQLVGDTIPRVVVDGRCRDLHEEEDPLDGPDEDEVVYERARPSWATKADREPDPDAGDGSSGRGQHEEEARVALEQGHPLSAALGQGSPLCHGEKEPAAHRKVRDQDVDDRDDRDDPRPA